MDPCIPIPLPDKQLEDLVEKAKDYALMHGREFKTNLNHSLFFFLGICMRQKNNFDRDALHFAPFVLFPTPFPRDEYNKSIKLQPILNELMHKVCVKFSSLLIIKITLYRLPMTMTS